MDTDSGVLDHERRRSVWTTVSQVKGTESDRRRCLRKEMTATARQTSWSELNRVKDTCHRVCFLGSDFAGYRWGYRYAMATLAARCMALLATLFGVALYRRNGLRITRVPRRRRNCICR